MHGWRDYKDGTFAGKSSTAFVGFLDFFGGFMRPGDEISHGGSLDLLGCDIVPEWIEGLVVEEKPRAERVVCRNVPLQNIDQSVDILGEEFLIVSGLLYAKLRVVLSRAFSVDARGAFVAQGVLALDADISCFVVVALEAVCSVGQLDAVLGHLTMGMLLIEALQTIQIGTVCAPDNGRRNFALCANALFSEHKEMVQAMSSGMCGNKATVAKTVMTRCADAISQCSLAFYAVEKPAR